MVLPAVELKLLPVKIWEKLRNANFGAQKRLRWPYSNTHNSESSWNIQVKLCTVSTDMLTHSLLNFHAIWRWSPGSLWPISNGMTPWALWHCWLNISKGIQRVKISFQPYPESGGFLEIGEPLANPSKLEKWPLNGCMICICVINNLTIPETL